MSVVSLATLKTYFETGDRPTQGEFEDLIDTLGQFVGVLVPFKLELSATQIRAGGSYDITELPAPGAGYAWRVLEASIKYTYNSIAFDNLTEFDVVTDGGRASHVAQYAAMAGTAADIFQQITPIDDPVTEIQIIENAKVAVELLGTPSTVGDGTAIIYGMARLITL